MSRRVRWAPVAGGGLLLAAVGLVYAAAPATPTPWAAGKVVGSPEPPPAYKAVNAFPKLKFDKPLLIAPVPGSDRLCVAEEWGKVFTFPNRPDAAEKAPFFDIKADSNNLPDGCKHDRVYGVAFHPKYPENKTVYICYTVRKEKVENLPEGTRVSRFQVAGDPPRVVKSSEQIVLTFLEGGHNGGDLHFGPDGMLYISTGDASGPNPPDPKHTGQDNTDLLCCILRIDVDRPANGKSYSVPADNPFVGLPDFKPEIWAYGFRNPWRMSFDKATGNLWVGDVGWELWEMVHLVTKGGNYGWSVMEARQPMNTHLKAGPHPITPPVIEIPHTDAGSVTGGYVYHGKKFPELQGKYVFGDWLTRRIWAATIENGRVTAMPELTRPDVRMSAFGVDHQGELYLAEYDAGTIMTLARNDAAAVDTAAFPRTLSATGLFTDVQKQTPAAGVTPYQVAAEQWQDGATAERFVALPGDGAVTDFEGKKVVGLYVNWVPARLHLPTNGVLVKTLTLETEVGNPASRKRIETQLLHFDGLEWRPYTYAWRDDQTDADLVPAGGADKRIMVRDANHAGGKREQTWTFSARAQCLTCHTVWAESALGFHPEQLNRLIDTPAGKRNQLAWLGEAGVLKRVSKDNKPLPPHTDATAAKAKKLASPTDESAPLKDRARAYLHANCGHCHRNGGGGAVTMELHHDADEKGMKAFDVPPARGTFDLPDLKLIAKGHPEKSAVYYRMAKFGSGRMPHFGSERPDPLGLKLISEWIAGSAPQIAGGLHQPQGAMELSRQIGTHQLPPGERDAVLKQAAESKVAWLRDLFDGYQPHSDKPRKLGPNPRPRTILAEAGDPDRGKAIFWSTRVTCQTCHKIDGQGQAVGPELTAIGKTRTRDELLESLLEPSRRVEPQYQSYTAVAADGRAVTGLLMKRDAKEVVLRDAQNKDHHFTAADLDKLTPARESLMPAGALADLTAAEAADLLAYLTSRK